MDGSVLTAPEAGEALPPPVRFTVRDAYAMTAAGVFRDRRVELIDGVFRLMPSEGPAHMRAVSRQLEKLILAMHAEGLLEKYSVSSHGTLILAEDTYVEPDLMIVDRLDGETETRAENVHLIIEDAVTSKPYDLGEKRRRYAAAGIPEMWVCEADKGVLHVFREPKDGAYTRHEERSGGEISLAALAGVTLDIASLLA